MRNKIKRHSMKVLVAVGFSPDVRWGFSLRYKTQPKGCDYLMFSRRLRNKGQIAPFMVLVIAVLILAIAATMLIGEAGFNHVRLANVADSSLISAASNHCRNLNQIGQIQWGSGGLDVLYWGLQAYLLARYSTCQCKLEPGAGMPLYGVWEDPVKPLVNGFVINTLLSMKKLYDNAEDIADRIPEDLRTSLYNSSFGAALIDEPKPFIEKGDNFDAEGKPIPYDDEDEVLRDKDGRVKALLYDRYAKRNAQFTDQYNNFRAGNKKGWFMNNIISYSFNKSLELTKKEDGPQSVICPGQINPGEPVAGCPDKSGEFQSYFRVELDNVAQKAKVEPQPKVLMYMWQLPITWCIPYGGCYCICLVLPMTIPLPEGAIRGVDVNTGDSFGITLDKKMPFKRIPVLEQKDTTLRHRSKARVKGTLRSGYDFSLEE